MSKLWPPVEASFPEIKPGMVIKITDMLDAYLVVSDDALNCKLLLVSISHGFKVYSESTYTIQGKNIYGNKCYRGKITDVWSDLKSYYKDQS